MCKFGVFVSFLRLCLLNWDGQHKECDWRINKDIWDNIKGIHDVAEWSGNNALIPIEWQIEDNVKK